MRIKCNPEDSHLEDGPYEESGETAASCVDYQTLGISRMRNPNISTEIIGDLEPGMTPFISTFEPKMSTYEPKDILPKQSFLDDSQLDIKTFKPVSCEFKRNYSQPEIKNNSSMVGEHSRDFFENQGAIRFHSATDSNVDQVDGNFIGGKVILGEFNNKVKEPLLPTFKDFSQNGDNNSSNNNNDNNNSEDASDLNQQEDEHDYSDETITGENIARGKPYALATLDGTIMLVQDEVILW